MCHISQNDANGITCCSNKSNVSTFEAENKIRRIETFLYFLPLGKMSSVSALIYPQET